MKNIKDIQIIKELENKYRVLNSKDVFNKIKEFNISYDVENFILITLNTKNKVIDIKNLFVGGIDSSLIDLRIIFKNALLDNAVKIIVGHNHPSRDLTPSSEDININNKIKEAGELMQINLIDFIIFNKEYYKSFVDEKSF